MRTGRSTVCALAGATFLACSGGGGGRSDAGNPGGDAGTPTYGISGTVSGAIVSGVTLGLTGASTAGTKTSGSGNYTFTGLADGSYTVTPSAAGYVFTPASRSVTVSGASVTGQDFSASGYPNSAPSGPPARQSLSAFGNVGLFVQFDERGWASGYSSGDVIQRWNMIDPQLVTPNTTVAMEVGSQLDKMKAMGVNTITVQLRTADATYTGTFTPPDCNEPPVLGLQFPQPTPTELANLPLFLDALQSRGMKVWLSLINVHMEEQPPTNSQTWIGAILRAVGSHPALDLVSFDGTPHTVTDASGKQICGVPAEAPLWSGPQSIPATYVQWAIGYAISLGVPPQKLAAEAIAGSFFLESQPPAGPETTGGHLWSPIVVEKMIFDNLNIAANQRTYALSFYEHRKCSDAQTLPCTDLDPHDWADQTLQYVGDVIGSEPRLVASEMGDATPVDQVHWITQWSVESLVFLMRKNGVNGGAFWRWANFQNSEDTDTTLAKPVKVRGTVSTYNAVQKEILDFGGTHLPAVPNGSFEGSAVSGVPASWTKAGNGTVSQYLLTQEAGQPEVPSRGVDAMRVVTGSGATDAVTASSAMIPAVAGTTYTTTANLRFSFSGDPNPGGPAALRPQVFMNVLYFQANGTASAVRAQDSSAFFQENSTTLQETGQVGFGTFPLRYTPPSDAAFVQIQFGAARNNLPSQIILDVDNVR